MALADWKWCMDRPVEAAEEIDWLRLAVGDLVQALHDAPYLKIDVRNARLRGEDEALKYADDLAKWVPRAKSLLDKYKTHKE